VRTAAGVYAICIGVAMMGMWSVFLATDNVPELEETPVMISFHMAAEFLTAIALLIGGFGLITTRSWGLRMYLIAMGMVLYSTISEGLGYYGEMGDVSMIVLFTTLTLVTAAFITMLLYGKENSSIYR